MVNWNRNNNEESYPQQQMDPSLKPSGSQAMQLSASILPNKKRIGRYEVIRLLGRGAFGTVKLGLDYITGNNVAIKILKHRNVQCERDFEMIDREKKALMLLDHPNIVKLLEIIEDEDKDATYLVFEYVGGGELFNYIVSKGRLAEPRARKFVRQIVSALEYCHYNLIVHRDLKPENLLLDENDNIKITDFGLANFITPNKFQTFCGSLHYAAPEILRSHAYGGPPVDIYALGIVLYCLVNGRQPFDAESAHDMVKKINQGLQYHAEVSKELRDLISRMLTVDPKKRITLAEVRMHPWIQDCRGPPPSYVPKIEPVTEIDEEIMKELVSLGFKDKPSTRHAIIKNKDKQVVSAYHLCRNRRKDTRERSRSVAQISKISLASSSTSLGRLRRASVSNATGIPFITSHVKRSQMGQGTASVADLKARHQIADPDKRKSDHTGIAGPSPSEISATTQSDSTSSKTLEDIDNLLDTIANNAKPMVFTRKTSRRQTTEIPYSPRQSQTTGALFPFPQKPENDQSSDKKTENETALEPTPVTTPVPTPVPVLPLNSPTVRINSPSKKRELTSSGQFRCDTTTTKRTKDIKKHIATTALKCALECEKVSRYSFKLHKQEVQVVFDIEIVKMKDFKNLKGLKFKRLEGDIWQYKQVVTEFSDVLRL